MKNRSLALAGLLVSSLSYSGWASAASIVNGSFDSDLSSWSTVTAGGTVVWNNGSAVLTTGNTASYTSALLVQGDDGFFNFPAPIHIDATDNRLNFDASFSTSLNLAETGASILSDYLQVILYDANNSSGNYILADIDTFTPNTSFSIDLAAYTGLTVALSFELRNFDDGYTSQVVLDNIGFSSIVSAIPEPNSILLLSSGLLGLMVKRSKKLITR